MDKKLSLEDRMDRLQTEANELFHWLKTVHNPDPELFKERSAAYREKLTEIDNIALDLLDFK